MDWLRESGVPLILLVAEEDGELPGHILFSTVSLRGSQKAHDFICGMNGVN
ncbi:MAG: hypothetical protein JXA38_04565 [Methanosarcinaceae archaeon]|nr:hypothetical protein [Methanosarcinaceae archaeon]